MFLHNTDSQAPLRAPGGLQYDSPTMPAVKRAHSHADAFADLDEPVPHDYDPEDDPVGYDESGSDSDPEVEGATDLKAAREHYAPAGKSELRQREAQALGPQYDGSRVSRKGMDVDEEGGHDPFAEESGSDSEGEEEEEEEDEDMEELNPEEGSGEEEEDTDDREDTDATSMSEDMDGGEDDGEDASEDNEEQVFLPRKPTKADPTDRSALRALMSQGQSSVSASLSAAQAADIRKGRAVKRQRRTYDALLNTRIRMQAGLVAMNSLSASTADDGPASSGSEEAYTAAYDAALALWNSLDSLRSTISSQSKDGKKNPAPAPATRDTTLDTLRKRTSHHSALTSAHTTSTLKKWSTKTASLTSNLTSSGTGGSRLNPDTAAQTTLFDILQTQHLSSSNVGRLVARAKTPRSCAPVQAAKGVSSDEGVYDDADFYGQLLKELLESRNVAAGAANIGEVNMGVNGSGVGGVSAEAAYRSVQRAAKVKKNVDVKASKGRKLKYTVHEKLQNFMAPEDRGAWGERQRDELFGSLLGKRLQLSDDKAVDGGDGDGQGGTDDEEMEKEEALRLFRS